MTQQFLLRYLPAKISVLHVDDEPSILEITKMFLRSLSKEKVSIDSLENPEEVLKQLQIKNYGIIISDYQMRNMNGIQLLSHLNNNHIDIPFIIFTGRGREEVAIDALNLGAKRYIKKGGDPKSLYTELLYVIQDLVSQQQIKSEYQKIVEHIPFGYAFLKIILDENKQVVDAIYQDINDFRAAINGMVIADFIGKKVTEIFPDHPQLPFYFQKFGEVIQTGKTTSFNIYSTYSNKWLRLILYRPVKDHIASFMIDISEFMVMALEPI